MKAKKPLVRMKTVNYRQEMHLYTQDIPPAPRTETLSEPYITDHGKTLVFFKRGSDVQEKARLFEEKRLQFQGC